MRAWQGVVLHAGMSPTLQYLKEARTSFFLVICASSVFI